MSKTPRILTARNRLLIAAAVGLIVGVIVAMTGQLSFIPLAAWDSAALTFVVSTLISVMGFNAKQTKQHATSENPGRTVADILLLVTSLASLAAIAVLLIDASNSHGLEKILSIVLGLVSVVVSWSVVHTLYLLQYARLYYSDTPGGIDFNDKSDPRYTDFAYLSFTVGMTFQVSDTVIVDGAIRRAILKHALLAYVFGTVIIATTINTLASLSK